MHLDNLLVLRDIDCGPLPQCNCPADQDCVYTTRTSDKCASFTCEPRLDSSTGSSKSGGVSKGALAGAIVAVLIFLGLAIGAFLWYRRRRQAESRRKQQPEAKVDVPAAAEDVLNRPDPSEKMQAPTELNTVRVYSSSSNTTIDLDPESQYSATHRSSTTRTRESVQSNPFTDTNSIQTAGTEGTNVIPIALVSPEPQESEHSRSSSPLRPARSPDMDLNLDHMNMSSDTLRTPNAAYADSQRSGASGAGSHRMSYQTNASYSSDFLEAPMIMTGTSGNVRHVLGAMKAEVISTPGSTLGVPATRPVVTSPLASTSFGPADTVKEDQEQDLLVYSDPFSDEYSPLPSSHAVPPSAGTTTTFGTTVDPDSRHISHQPIMAPPPSAWSRDASRLQSRPRGEESSRPSSVSTQAGSVIDIGSATRVNVGLAGVSQAHVVSMGKANAANRTTMGRLVTPPVSAGTQGTLSEQQQRSFTADTSGGKRSSASSAVSATADSILESFPFVPPSPISDRPARNPSSPLAKQTFTNNVPTKAEAAEDLPPPPDRRTLGLSTGSQLSTASSGLGSFPFQIDHGSTPPPPTAFKGASLTAEPTGTIPRQRASLDTLALTSDLASYPLSFDGKRD